MTIMTREFLAEANPEALTIDGADEALIGVAERCSQESVAIYSYEKLVDHFMSDGMSADEAREWINFNILGAWMGPHTPIVMVFEQ